MVRLVSFLALFMFAAPLTAAQPEPETPATEIENQSYIFSGDDIMSVLTPAQKSTFDQYQQDLRELQELGRSLRKGSENRRGIQELFDRKKQERDEQFGFIRGINGVSVTLWGSPLPHPQDVVAMIVMERQSGAGDGIVWPHWELRRDGAIVGSAEPPSASLRGDDIPAGPEVNLGTYGVNTGGGLETTSCSEDPPASIRNPVCQCNQSTLTYGISSLEICIWVEGS